MKRELMDKIHILGITYGKYKQENNNYWFNAESQLKQICIENKIDFFHRKGSKNFTHKIKSPFLIRWLHVNLLKNNYPNINNDIRMLLGSNKILIFRLTACFKTRVSTSYSLAST